MFPTSVSSALSSIKLNSLYGESSFSLQYQNQNHPIKYIINTIFINSYKNVPRYLNLKFTAYFSLLLLFDLSFRINYDTPFPLIISKESGRRVIRASRHMYSISQFPVIGPNGITDIKSMKNQFRK